MFVYLFVCFLLVHARPFGPLVFETLTFSITDGLKQSIPISFIKK